MNEMDEKEVPVYNPEKPLFNALLQKVYGGNDKNLEQDIKAEMDKSGNRLAALKRIAFAKGRKESPDTVSITGYYLQTYRRQPTPGQDDRGFSTYLATTGPETIRTIHFDSKSDLPNPKESGVSMNEFGNPQIWTGLKQIENVISGSTYINVEPGKTKFKSATKEEIGKSLWEIAKPYQDANIKDALGIWRAYISGISQVKRFGSDEKLQVLGNGGEAHLNVIITENPPRQDGRMDRDGLFVELTADTQLRALLGSLYDSIDWMDEESLQVVRQSLVQTPVLAFGSGLTTKSDRLPESQKEKMKRNKIKLNNGLGLIVPFSA